MTLDNEQMRIVELLYHLTLNALGREEIEYGTDILPEEMEYIKKAIDQWLIEKG